VSLKVLFPEVLGGIGGGGKKNTLLSPKFNSEFTPEKWWERKTILSYW